MAGDAELETSGDPAEALEDCVDAGAAAGADTAGLLGCGGTGLGAETPAILDPSPNFCRLSALILPEDSKALSD